MITCGTGPDRPTLLIIVSTAGSNERENGSEDTGDLHVDLHSGAPSPEEAPIRAEPGGTQCRQSGRQGVARHGQG